MNHRDICAVALVGIGVIVAFAMTTGNRLFGQSDSSALDQPTQTGLYAYQLHVGSVATVVEYSSCTGLGSSSEILEDIALTEGGTSVIERTPGPLHWASITLRRSEPSDQTIWGWRKAMEDGDLDNAFRDGSIIMLRTDPPQTIAQWTFHHGWVSSLTIDGSIEQLTIVHSGLDRVPPDAGVIHKR